MKDKRKKVLFFLPNCLGGAEHVLTTIAKFLDRDRYDVKFVIVSSQTHDVMKILPKGYDIVHLFVRNIWDFTTFKMVRLMKREKPNIVFSSLIYLNARVVLAAKIVGNIKIIIRNNIAYSISPKYNKLFIRLFYKYADVIISQQDEMRDELLEVLKLPPERIITLHNPIDTQLIDENIKEPSPYNIEDNSIKFIWTGRICPEKGQDILIKAFKTVKEHIANAHLYILGKYDENDLYSQTLNSLITKYQLEDRVHFAGFQKNPHRWIKHADCFVQPSLREGLPNTLIEAMYIGIPVVATTCLPIIERMVKDGYNGYLVAPEDVESMAIAMQKALNLSNFQMLYSPAKPSQFVELFN